ncbi:MAG TPA: hypothetical protein VGB68_01070, partial [Pyrinomonadaceae bacterium]
GAKARFSARKSIGCFLFLFIFPRAFAGFAALPQLSKIAISTKIPVLSLEIFRLKAKIKNGLEQCENVLNAKSVTAMKCSFVRETNRRRGILCRERSF